MTDAPETPQNQNTICHCWHLDGQSLGILWDLSILFLIRNIKMESAVFKQTQLPIEMYTFPTFS